MKKIAQNNFHAQVSPPEYITFSLQQVLKKIGTHVKTKESHLLNVWIVETSCQSLVCFPFLDMMNVYRLKKKKKSWALLSLLPYLVGPLSTS